MKQHSSIPADDDFGTICICAVRYALGRRTYIPSIVCRFVKNHVQHMTDKDLFVIKRDITEHDVSDYGDDCDCDDWMRLLASVEHEIEKRKSE